jgi:hypothetical protein
VAPEKKRDTKANRKSEERQALAEEVQKAIAEQKANSKAKEIDVLRSGITMTGSEARNNGASEKKLVQAHLQGQPYDTFDGQLGVELDDSIFVQTGENGVPLNHNGRMEGVYVYTSRMYNGTYMYRGDLTHLD